MAIDIKDALIDGVSLALKGMVPKAVAEALEGQALAQESPMTKAVLLLFADYARTNGAQGIDALASNLKRALESDDPAHIIRLAGEYDSLYMSNLVDALQSAEAEAKEQSSEICAQVGTVLGNVGELVIAAAIAAITEGVSS